MHTLTHTHSEFKLSLYYSTDSRKKWVHHSFIHIPKEMPQYITILKDGKVYEFLRCDSAKDDFGKFA